MRDLIFTEAPRFEYGDLIPAGTQLDEVGGTVSLPVPYLVTRIQATRSAQPGNPLVWIMDLKPLPTELLANHRSTMNNPTNPPRKLT